MSPVSRPAWNRQRSRLEGDAWRARRGPLRVIEQQLAGFVALLIVAALVGTLVQRIPVPYETALALVGLGAGVLLGPQPFHLTAGLILFILLPGLLFEAAFNINWRHLRDNAASVVSLATVGVLVTTIVVGLLGHAALGLALPAAVLFGSIVSATDPVAVLAVFRRLRVPSRLANLVESESLLNDGTGVVIFTIALGAAQTGRLALGPAAVQFVVLSVGGCLLGTAVGLALSLVASRIDDPQVEITLTAIAAYGGYLLAGVAHVSPILCVVCAALVLGNVGRPRAMSQRTQTAVGVFWDYVAFVLNTVVFLLIGLSVPWRQMIEVWPLALGAAGIVLLARAVTVYPLMALLRPFVRAVNWRWQHVVVWSGLRGAIALALVLSLQATSPGRFVTIGALVYGVVLISIVVQGATIGPLIRLVLPHEPGHPHRP